MNVKVIKTEKEYEAALSHVEELMEKSPLSREDGETLNLLSLLISIYEKNQFPIESPSPVDAILFRMEQENLKREDLIPLIGSKSKVSEIFSGKRQLSKQMIRNLHSNLGIPLESLMGDQDEEEKEAF